MNSTLTTDDLTFLQALRQEFDKLDFVMSFNQEKQSFSWAKNKRVNSLATNYNPHMIEAFIDDLIQGTQTYDYDVYYFPNDCLGANIIWNRIFSYSENTSDLLKLRMFKLLNAQQFNDIIPHAIWHCSNELMFEFLAIKTDYPTIKSGSKNEKLSILTDVYQLFSRKNIDIKLIEQSFFNHLKNCQIKMPDEMLINLFLSIFPKERLPNLYSTFNLQKEETVLETQENALSIITLSLKQLMMSELDYMSLGKFFEQYPKKNADFPCMFLLSKNNTHVQIAVASGNGNEEKVKLLFEQMIAKQYSWKKDKKAIVDLMSQINEVVYLDKSMVASHVKPVAHKI